MFEKKIYILPNIFTTMNIFCGFFALISAINGRFEAAASAILIAIVFDILDGKIARLTKTTSNFGVQYDSLADLLSFGVAPSVTIYLWALEPFLKVGWMAGFLFTICGALRLARFNSQIKDTPSNYFIGLPIPAAAGTLAAMMLFFDKFGISTAHYSLVILFALYALSFLMVSTIKYNSFKKTSSVKEKTRFDYLMFFILIFICIVIEPAISLFILAVAYISLGFFNLFRFSVLKKGKEIKNDV